MHYLKNLFVFVFIFSLIGEYSFSQTVESRTMPSPMTASKLTDKLPKDFKGILYNCDPLCNFISVKVNQDWNPPLEKVPITILNPSWIGQSDPLYPLLIQELPIRPYIENATSAEKKPEKKSDELLPIPPQVPFNYGYSFLLGGRFLLSKISTNSTLQEEMNPSSPFTGLSAQLSLIRLKPVNFLNQWLQFRFNYEMNPSTAVTLASEKSLRQAATDRHLETWIMKQNYKLALRLGQTASEYLVTPNTLSSYSFKENWTWIGAGVLYKRYQISADYGLFVALNEEQPYRDTLLKSQFLRLASQWCSPTKSLFDINYGFCVKLSKQLSETTSGLRPELGSTESVSIRVDETSLNMSLRFGDDFYL